MKTRLRLSDYFAIEALSAMANTLLIYCLYFYARDRFGYSDTENLFLGAAQGVTYVIFARYGGRLTERIGYERTMLAGYTGLALLALTGALPSWRGWPFVLVLLYMACIAPTWPSLEAAITHCPARATLPERLGIYNVTWALFNSIGFFIGGSLFAWRRDAILWVPGLIHLVQIAWLLLARRRGEAVEGEAPAMDLPHSGHEIGAPAKRTFLHTAWTANAISYFLSAGFGAIIPHLGDRLGLPPTLTIWLTCTVFFSRTIGFVAFWRWEGWHYRMAWSQAALWLAPACAAVVFFSTSKFVVFAALLAWGLAQALSYYTSLYYSMDVGEKKGEHGGLHEAVLGIGVLGGPLAGAMGSLAFGNTAGAKGVILACGAIASLAGSVAARQSRRRADPQTGGAAHV